MNILFISGKITDATITATCYTSPSFCIVQTGAYWRVTASTIDPQQ